MGCWNGTDGFGGMPIRANEKVKTVIIQNNVHMPPASGFCSLIGYAMPISFPIDAQYNDYGSLENISDDLSSKMLFSFLSDELKSGIIKIIPDYSKTYDINKDPTVIDSVDTLQEFIDLIERDRVYRANENYFTKKITFTNIGLMMFSDDIYQSILFENPLSDIKKDIEYFVEDVFLSAAEEKMDEDTKSILADLENKEEKDSHTLDMIKRIKQNGSLFSNYWDNRSRSVGKYYNSVQTLKSFDAVDVDAFKIHYSYIVSGSFQKEEIEKTIFDMISIIRFMSSLRRPWMGTFGKGSQGFDSSVFSGFIKGILEQTISNYKDLIGKTVYCYESYLEFKEDEEYVVSNVGSGNIYFIVEGETISLTFNEFDNCLEY